MARFLFCPWPAPGDLNPFLALGSQLKGRGHEVALFLNRSTSAFGEAAEFTTFEARSSLDPYPEECFGDTSPEGVLFTAEHLIKDIWAHAGEYADEIAGCGSRFKPDVLIDGGTRPGAQIAAHLLGVRHFTLNVLFGQIWSDGVTVDDPSGNAMADWNAALADHGLPREERSLRQVLLSKDTVLVPSIPEFDLRRKSMPLNTRYVGPLVWDWGDVPADTLSGGEAAGPSVDIVVATQGTAHIHEFSVLETIAYALRDQAAISLHALLDKIHHDRLPQIVNDVATVHGYVPLRTALRDADLLVCHGGTGTVTIAATQGVPVLVMPVSQEHVHNGLRVSELGLGRVLPTLSSPVAVRAAVYQLLRDKRVSERCSSVGAELRRWIDERRASRVVEELLA